MQDFSAPGIFNQPCIEDRFPIKATRTGTMPSDIQVLAIGFVIILAEFGIWWGDWPDAPTIDCADGCVVFCFCPKLNKSCMFIFIIFGSAIWALFILCSGGCKDDIIIHLITAKAVAFLLT
ncbi:hypothetical protein MUK42_36636, partial [Musa troglodytarum]